MDKGYAVGSNRGILPPAKQEISLQSGCKLSNKLPNPKAVYFNYTWV